MMPKLTIDTALCASAPISVSPSAREGFLFHKELNITYLIKKKLGGGSFGDVYLATSPKGSNYAVKVHEAGDLYFEAAKKESEILKLVQCPHVVKYFSDFDVIYMSVPEPAPVDCPTTQHSCRHVILMELLTENMRAKYIKSQRPHKTPTLSSVQILSIAKQALETLQHFESVGCVHGDLKPNNLAYDESTDWLTIYDFGSSHLMQTPVSANIMTQNISYRAPEQMMRKLCTSSIDIWSLGVILFELHTGRHLINVVEGDNSEIDYFHLMTQQIGPFSAETISSASPEIKGLVIDTVGNSDIAYKASRRAKKMMDHYAEISATIPGKPIWQARMSRASRIKGRPVHDADPLIALIAPMLRYENRIRPNEALCLLSQITFGVAQQFASEANLRNLHVSLLPSSRSQKVKKLLREVRATVCRRLLGPERPSAILSSSRRVIGERLKFISDKI